VSKTNLLIELRKEFSKQKNPKIAKEQQRYMKSKMPYYGLQAPQLKKIYSSLFDKYMPTTNQEYRNTILYVFKNAKHREEWYAGLAFANKYQEYIVEENIDLYVEIIRLTQWWDTIDNIAPKLIGTALADSNNLPIFLNEWIKDENLWIRRTALLTQLKYKERTDFKLLSKLIKQVWHEEEFFIRKAIGWTLRQHSYSSPNEVLNFIEQNRDNLSHLSITEGLKALKREGIV
tara:strand:+ start:858 stop:1553 length:696 start_codon:yes stop_codon:yes gene_type:complete